MYRTVVTICTASLTFNNSTFCPHCVFVYFVWISEQTAIISLYNNNWMVFVYCAVQWTIQKQRKCNSIGSNGCRFKIKVKRFLPFDNVSGYYAETSSNSLSTLSICLWTMSLVSRFKQVCQFSTFFPQLSLTKECLFVPNHHQLIGKRMSQGRQRGKEHTWENIGEKYPNMAANMAAGCRMSMEAPQLTCERIWLVNLLINNIRIINRGSKKEK
jgi:hypothetical protein